MGMPTAILTVLPQNLPMVRFCFKASFGAATIQGRLLYYFSTLQFSPCNARYQVICIIMSLVSIIQGQRMPCNSEGAQRPGTRTISHLEGVGGMLPQENFEFFDSKRALLRPSESSFEASFYCIIHTKSIYT